MSPTPPIAEKRPYLTGIHGDILQDEYYWMIDYFRNGPESRKVLDYLAKENDYFEEMTAGIKGLQQQLLDEMKGRIFDDEVSAPVLLNGYYYYRRTETGMKYFKYCRRRSLDGEEEVLCDVEEMAAGHEYYHVTGLNVSDDGKLLAFGVDEVSRRQYVIFIKDLDTGAILEERIPDTTGLTAWAADNRHLFYVANNPQTLLSEKIKLHKISTDCRQDIDVYTEHDRSNYLKVAKSRSKKYIVIQSEGTLSSEVRLIRSDEPQAESTVFQPRVKGVLYSIYPLENEFLVLTNWQAENFRLMECSQEHTEMSGWKEVVPARNDVLLFGIKEYRRFVTRLERCKGLVRLVIRNLETRQEHALAFEEPAYSLKYEEDLDYELPVARYSYASLVTPASIYDYDMLNRQAKLAKYNDIKGGYDPAGYVTERLYADAEDGAQVPISAVYKKGLVKDGTSPLLLYGYGAYGLSMDATFSASRLSLLDRGFVFAIAHIRGGQELGRNWYEEGKLLKKKNTFTDFIACAKYLIALKFVSPHKIYAQGGSAGGLLMGAVINMEPGLWKGVILQVPFVDVLHTMLDESIPLTTNEFDEWGNPMEPHYYEYIKSYSPYENIKKKAYPHALVTAGLHDSQVQYFEPAKWVARLRAMKSDDHLLLFRTNMSYGHTGGAGKYDHLAEAALHYSFLLALEDGHLMSEDSSNPDG